MNRFLVAHAETSREAIAPLEQLDPPSRAVVVMALLGILLLGMFLVAMILLGGRWARRGGENLRQKSTVPPRRADGGRGLIDASFEQETHTDAHDRTSDIGSRSLGPNTLWGDATEDTVAD